MRSKSPKKLASGASPKKAAIDSTTSNPKKTQKKYCRLRLANRMRPKAQSHTTNTATISIITRKNAVRMVTYGNVNPGHNTSGSTAVEYSSMREILTSV